MAIAQSRPKRKESGGRYIAYRKKKQHELGGDPSFTRLSPRKTHVERVMGGHIKIALLSEDSANLYNPKTRKYANAKIKTITGNPANRHFIRRNIITKGCVIETELGKARVTSRPGQHGIVNAVMI